METQDYYHKSKEFAIDYVQSIVEDSLSIYNPYNLSCINGIIEIVLNEVPTNLRFGIVIFNNSEVEVSNAENEIIVDVTHCFDYIKCFEMRVILVVVDSNLYKNYWVDVKKLIIDLNCKEIFIKKEISNEFCFETFNNIIVEYLEREKSSFQITERFINNPQNVFFKNFINSHFKIIDYSIPFIISSSNLNEFLGLIEIGSTINNNWFNAFNLVGRNITHNVVYDNTRNIWFLRVEEEETYYIFTETTIKYLDDYFLELQKGIE